MPSKTGAPFWSDFTFEYFEYKTFRTEERCSYSVNIWRSWGKGGKQESLKGKKKSFRIISRDFLFSVLLCIQNWICQWVILPLSCLSPVLFQINGELWSCLIILYLKLYQWFRVESLPPFLWGPRRKETLHLTFLEISFLVA